MAFETVAADLLRLARAKSDMSQRELAAAAGVSQPTIAAYEAGRRQPTVPVLWKLLTAAGWEPRVRLAEPDQQWRLTAEWEASRPQEERDRWAREQADVEAHA